MAEAKTNAMRMLERAKIPYEMHTYDHSDGQIDGISVARKVGLDPDTVFKTLVTRGASREIYVFVLPVAKELDLKKAARSVGEKSIELVKIEEINKLTGYIRGGCSPVGMKKPIPPSSMLQLRASPLSQSVEAGSALKSPYPQRIWPRSAGLLFPM